MGRLLGKKLIVELSGTSVNGDVVTIFGMSTNCSISVNTDMVEIASTWNGRSYLPQRYEYSLQVERLCSLDNMEKTILLWQLYRIQLSFRLLRRDGDSVSEVMTGKAYISGYSMGAPVQGFATSNITLQGTDELYIIGYE